MNVEEITRLYGLGQNVAHLTGLTDWTTGIPPGVGWWNVRMVGCPDTGARRWWDGFGWSVPVQPGFHGPDEVRELARMASQYSVHDLEWRGIKPPELHGIARG